jgi:hypothetical protein
MLLSWQCVSHESNSSVIKGSKPWEGCTDRARANGARLNLSILYAGKFCMK